MARLQTDSPFAPETAVMRSLYAALAGRYGVQPWWPADSVFEILVGAVLTQNAAWTNVEKAIDRMRAASLLSLDAVLATDHDGLADAIRPSGYFNVKARRLRNLCDYLSGQGGVAAFGLLDAGKQRHGLLSVNGVGPETADDILLYAFDRPVFVIDTYTRRLLARYGLASGTESYEQLRAGFERALGADVALFQQYHALIVMHAKMHCLKTPRCAGCCLSESCPAAVK